MAASIKEINEKCSELKKVKEKIDEIEAKKQLLWDKWMNLRAVILKDLEDNDMKSWKYDDPNSDKYMTISVVRRPKVSVTDSAALVAYLKRTPGLDVYVQETYTPDFLRGARKVLEANPQCPGLELTETESISIQFPIKQKAEAKNDDAKNKVNDLPF